MITRNGLCFESPADKISSRYLSMFFLNKTFIKCFMVK